ncbi:hypothetical protein KI387_027308, partial [Taxus chinensis]
MEWHEVVDNVGGVDALNFMKDMMNEVENEHVAVEHDEQTEKLMEKIEVGYTDADGVNEI